MKKLISALLLIAACQSSAPAPAVAPAPAPTPTRALSGTETGAPDALSAVRAFMSAVKQTDLQAMGAIWGDNQGPARDRLTRDELEKREFVMMCSLHNDRYDLLPDAPTTNGARAVPVTITAGPLTRTTTFTVVEGPSHRWYVQNVDVTHLEGFCSRHGS